MANGAETPLRVECSKCGAVYLVRGDILPPAGVKSACQKCGFVIHMKRPDSDADAAPAAGGGGKRDLYDRLYGGAGGKKPK